MTDRLLKIIAIIYGIIIIPLVAFHLRTQLGNVAEFITWNTITYEFQPEQFYTGVMLRWVMGLFVLGATIISCFFAIVVYICILAICIFIIIGIAAGLQNTWKWISAGRPLKQEEMYIRTIKVVLKETMPDGTKVYREATGDLYYVDGDNSSKVWNGPKTDPDRMGITISLNIVDDFFGTGSATIA